jgi:Undecaprenyl-phosphate glucose phosphotransferase
MAIQFTADSVRYVDLGHDSGRIFTEELLSRVVKVVDLVTFPIFGVVALKLVGGPKAIDHTHIALIGLASAANAALLRALLCYRQDYLFSATLRLTPALAANLCAAAVLTALALAAGLAVGPLLPWLAVWLATEIVFQVGFRLGSAAAIARMVRNGAFALRTVILGAGARGEEVATWILKEGALRVQLLGFIDERRSRLPNGDAAGAVLGDLDHLRRLIREDAIDQVVVALPWSAAARLRDLVAQLAIWPIRIALAPEANDEGAVGWSGAGKSRFSMVCLSDRPMSDWAAVAKRAEDIAVSTMALFVLLWPMLLVAAAIKLGSPGPVVFKQRRYGFKNNYIEMYKFRTMHHHLCDADASVLTTRGDPRVTRVGRFLRRTSLDELPQLFNVLKGEMSIVGPRPHALQAKAAGRLYSDIVPHYASRHRVKPGITGWAQINGWRGETDTVEKIQKRVEHDLVYVENWSLWFDLLILTRTALGLFNDPNAY